MLFRANFKKNSKGRCFIAEKFQIIHIDEAVNFISTFKIFFETWRFFGKSFDKSRLKVGKIKMPEFQKMHVRRPGNRKHSFFITRIFY